MISLRELRYFVAVAEARHFGHAAQRLNIAQPALSRAIKNLEAKLGVALFVRTSREVLLTEAGAELLGDAQEVLTAGNHMLEHARALAADTSGAVLLGYLPFIELTAQELIDSFMGVAHGVEVAHRREYNKSLKDAVARGEVDAAITFADPGRRDGFLRTPFVTLPLLAVVGQKHPLARRESVSPQELSSFPLAYPRVPEGDVLSRLLGPSFDAYGVTASWVEVDSAIARHPAVISNSAEYVWLQTPELRHADDVVLVEIDPALVVPFDLISLAGNPNPALPTLISHATRFAADRDSARHGSDAPVV